MSICRCSDKHFHCLSFPYHLPFLWSNKAWQIKRVPVPACVMLSSPLLSSLAVALHWCVLLWLKTFSFAITRMGLMNCHLTSDEASVLVSNEGVPLWFENDDDDVWRREREMKFTFASLRRPLNDGFRLGLALCRSPWFNPPFLSLFRCLRLVKMSINYLCVNLFSHRCVMCKSSENETMKLLWEWVVSTKTSFGEKKRERKTGRSKSVSC